MIPFNNFKQLISFEQALLETQVSSQMPSNASIHKNIATQYE